MTVPREAYTLKLNKIIEPNVRIMRVHPTDLKVTLGHILSSLTSACWIGTLAPYLQPSYQVRAANTIDMFNELFESGKTSALKSSTGEYVVSELSRSSVVNELHYLDIPLGELIKEQKSGNSGFDFFTVNGDIILFGEAKYIAGQNAYSSAFEQVGRFVNEKRDLADLPDLLAFASPTALKNASQGVRGLMAGFSSTDMSDDVLERHILDNSYYKAVPKNNELICIAVDLK